jgi:uncharacterized membrane protein YfcA
MEKPRNPTPWEALGIVWDLLIAIAVPVVLFALLGRWLDQKYGRSPLFTALGLVLALAIVVVIVQKKGKDIAKRL